MVSLAAVAADASPSRWLRNRRSALADKDIHVVHPITAGVRSACVHGRRSGSCGGTSGAGVFSAGRSCGGMGGADVGRVERRRYGDLQSEQRPGYAAEPAYTSALASFRAAGGTAVAYVHTHNSDGSLRTAAAVDDEINRYRSFYQFDGIFIDEMSNTNTDLTYYSTLFRLDQAKNANYLVIGNPGTNVPSGYSAAADKLVRSRTTP